MREQYLKEVRDLIDSMRIDLSADEAAEVEHLVDHNEPAEGLLTLAWIMHNKRKFINTESKALIVKLIGDLVPDIYFPPNLRDGDL